MRSMKKTQIVWKKEGNNNGHELMGCRKGWEPEMTSAERTTDPGSEVKTHFIRRVIRSRRHLGFKNPIQGLLVRAFDESGTP